MKPVQNILWLVKYLFKILLNVFGFILKKILHQKHNLIILEGTDAYRYNENTKYLFEHLSRDNDLDVYWFTSSKIVDEHVRRLGFKSLYKAWDKFRIMPRARMVISTGSCHIDYYNTIGEKTIKYCLMHGIGPKASVYSGKSEIPIIRELLSIHKFDYLNFTSSYVANIVGKLAYKTPFQKIVILGYPRNDLFFNKNVSECAMNFKKKCQKMLPNMNKDAKVLLYTPTWRKDKSTNLPIYMLNGFDIAKFNNFLQCNNLYMICTIHPNITFTNTMNWSNICIASYEKDHLFDINILMMEVDMLLNDYSTTSTDYCILDRPQIFVMPDYEEYKHNDCFVEDYRAILPGKEVFSNKELEEEILHQLANPSQYADQRKKFLNKYYDVNIKNSCNLHRKFIKRVLSV